MKLKTDLKKLKRKGKGCRKTLQQTLQCAVPTVKALDLYHLKNGARIMHGVSVSNLL